MPGNETIYKSPRFWLPVSWGVQDFAAGQTTPQAMPINGFPAGIYEFSLPRKMSLVTVGIELDAAVTAGFIRFQLARNGSLINGNLDMDSGAGLRRLIEFTPGELVGDKGDRIGIAWGSSGTLAPAGSIDGIILMEMEPV